MNTAELHLIIGPMFSGKTTELLRIARRLDSIGLKVLLINYSEDTRYSTTELSSHDKVKLPCKFSNDLLEVDYSDFDVVCINEAQFFTELKTFCKYVLADYKKMYVSGLDGDFKQDTFGEIVNLIPLANSIVKLNAYCKMCKNGTLAPFTRRLTECKDIKMIGTEEYIAVCRSHLNYESLD